MRKYHLKKFYQNPLYKYEPWTITEKEFKIENNHHNETIFALGNGYMGLRGTLEEDYSGPEQTTTPGTYINGVYTEEKIIYGEEAPDLPEFYQTMVNLADWTGINLYLGDEKFDMLQGKVSGYKRVLDMKEGTLTRELTWESPQGRKVKLTIKRFLSLASPHIGVIKYSFTPVNFDGTITVESSLKGDVQNYHTLRNKKPLQVIDKAFSDGMLYLVHKIKNSGIEVATAVKNVISAGSGEIETTNSLIEGDKVIKLYKIEASQGQEYTLEKYACLYHSLEIDKEDIVDKVITEVSKAAEKGWDYLFENHCQFLQNYWDDVDIKIYGDDALQQALRFNAFHLIQSTGRDGKTNIAAKGLTGEYYEGHYFWDTETYILPFYLYSKPEISKDLLMFRYYTLDEARENARRMRLDGALYPWRTINGKEASGFFMGSTVQYHIDADIAYAINLYVTATRDYDFLFNYGAEILFETARMWASRGSYIELKGNRFCINEVCGPDEYKPGVNNNCYTNYMAKLNLELALEAYRLMEKKAPDNLKKLVEKINLQDSELEAWKRAADNMYLPYNEELGIHPQDDSFLYKDPIDVDSIPEEDIPLVKNWHPLVIWRYQVIKQADVILLMLLLGDQFTTQQKKANYDFYEPKTTHDSSLSPAIYSIIASEIGYHDSAYNYFMQTARLDLDDYNKNAYQGVHTACMAGTWLALVQGFAGMRNYNGELHFSPCLPEKWDGYEFKVKFRGRQLKITVNEEGVMYKLIKGEKLSFYHGDRKLELNSGEEHNIEMG
ncbi:glycoside hydrolase family 65 protein [Halothermothrix orenii]|uniref:Kojibiose phosphorylase n=1 Tax=Halothermothrix orenii (strain H 168 / OCM 544 / DSM 9562) TaxID=373903 RepID=B8CY36_HALOH|nr:glycosyl hydrolase family 65 protein [Halothermothrix orenii]ACL70205.1 Kojibiose phosphorylase [Halothermothrix orenii H 168]